MSGRRCQEKTCRLPASAEALPWQVWDLYTLHLERVVRVYTRLGVGQAGPWQARSAPGRARHPAAQNTRGSGLGGTGEPVLSTSFLFRESQGAVQGHIREKS